MSLRGGRELGSFTRHVPHGRGAPFPEQEEERRGGPLHDRLIRLFEADRRRSERCRFAHRGQLRLPSAEAGRHERLGRSSRHETRP